MYSVVHFWHGHSVGVTYLLALYGMTLDEGHYYNNFLFR